MCPGSIILDPLARVGIKLVTFENERRKYIVTDLFEAVGTVFDVGDGSITFNLSDLRGEFIRGVDSGCGADTGVSQGCAYKSHSHPAPDGSNHYVTEVSGGGTSEGVIGWLH